MNILLGIIASAIYLSLPGITTLITFRLHEEMDIIEFITSALFLSLMIESLLSTAILYLGGSRELLIPVITVYTVVLGTLGVMQIKRGDFKLRKLSREDRKVLIPIITLTILLVIHLYKYPIFHASMSKDPGVHTEYVQQLLMENPRDVIEKINYPLGLHVIAMQLTLLTNIHPVYVVRYFAAYLTILTISLAYIMTKELFDEDTAFWVTMIYQIMFLIPYGHFSISGMYANILGDIHTMFIIYWWSKLGNFNLNLNSVKNLGTILITCFLGISALWSHYSTFIILTLLPFFSILMFIVQKMLDMQESSNYIYKTLYAFLLWMLIPILLLIYQKSLSNILNIFSILQGEPMLICKESLIAEVINTYLSQIRILAYLSMFTNIHFYIIMVSIIYLIYLVITNKNIVLGGTLVLLWSFYIILWSFQGGNIIRLTIQLIFPLSIAYSILISKIYSVLISRYLCLSNMGVYSVFYKKFLFVFIILFILALGYIPEVTCQLRDISFSRKKQFDILDSMLWINSHIPYGAKILSIGLKEYRHYFNALTGYHYDYKGDILTINVSELNKIIKVKKADYIIVWRYIHINATYLTNEIEKCSRYLMIYQNDNIEIFYLK